MTSFGEGDVIVESNIVGKIRVRSIYPATAVYPRLGIALGVTLHERAGDERAPKLTRNPYEMRDAHGELRLKEHGDVVGTLLWLGARRSVRSANYGMENQLQLACDLDFHRLEQVEKRRSGGEALFWLALWPLLANETTFLDADVPPFRTQIPRDEWLRFYSAVGGGQFDILEVYYSTKEAEQFKRAVSRVREAREKLNLGEYDAAVSVCRNAIDALRQEMGPSGGDDPLEACCLDGQMRSAPRSTWASSRD